MRVNRELLDWEVRISSFELASVDIFESVDIVEHWYHSDNTSVGLVQPYCLLLSWFICATGVDQVNQGVLDDLLDTRQYTSEMVSLHILGYLYISSPAMGKFGKVKKFASLDQWNGIRWGTRQFFYFIF